MTLPKAAILAIGSELTAGRTIDTNSGWLAKELAALGITCVLQIACPDDMDLMVQSLDVVTKHADLVIVTGGLGPTADDFTRDAVAKFAGVELELDQGSLDRIRDIFERLGRAMPDTNQSQAMFPVGSEVLFNDQGTAPGFVVTHNQSSIMVAPGVPREMKAMYSKQMLPRLRALIGGDSYHIAQRVLRTCAVSESKLDRMLAGVEEHDVEVAFAVKEAEGTIMLTYTARGEDKESTEARVDAAVVDSERRLGSLICARGTQSLPERVIELLQAKGQEVAIVEGESGGRLSSFFTNHQGSEAVLKKALILIGPERQAPFLGTNVPDTLKDRALALARKIRDQEQVAYGIAVIGPGPEPEGNMTLAVVGPKDEVVKERGSSILVQQARNRFLTLAAAYALDATRRMLEENTDR
ncbi:MAG: molybdopterin-binding protein [Planctomycetota bacterium]|nr:molybdopterin-binding protein [Planctomycetota bacterium]